MNNRKLIMNSKGSVTLEASIIIPTIMLILISLAFFSMYIYHKVVLMDSAVYSATQTAAAWDNSSKELESLKNTSNSHDDIYWRILDDFSDSKLTANKINRTNNLIEKQLQYGVFTHQELNKNKMVNYQNNFFLSRTITVNIKQNVILPVDWLGNFLGSNIAATAKADAVEPVEYIRNIDLAAMWLGDLKNGQEKDGKNQIVYYSVLRGVYHYPGCRYIKNIKEQNLYVAAREDEAIKSGRRLCKICAKSKNH